MGMLAVALALSAFAVSRGAQPPLAGRAEEAFSPSSATATLPATAAPRWQVRPSLQAAGEEVGSARNVERMAQVAMTPNEVDSQSRSADASSDDPPPEFFPPPRKDVPVLQAAAGRKLKFGINIPCRSACPDLIFWVYKKENDSNWTYYNRKSNTDSHYDFCNASQYIDNLDYGTEYYVKACPMTARAEDKYSTYRWYNKTKNAPYTDDVKGLTCERDVPPVKDLRVHTSGPKWLAVSWLPPNVSCLTHLAYHVRHFSTQFPANNLTEEVVGSFWSNAMWAVTGLVTPCLAWPDRHCLLISGKSDIRQNKEFTVEVKVTRTEDQVESIWQSVNGSTYAAAPGPPEDLHCARAQPTELELRWRCPLSPGGILTFFHMDISPVNGTVKETPTEKVKLQPEYRKTIKGLQPYTWYKLSVWFSTKDGKAGRQAVVEVWTPPLKNATAPDKPQCARRRTLASSMRSHNGTGNSAGLSSDGDGADGDAVPWVWIAACMFLLLMVVVALFVGHRWGSQKLWILAPHDDGRNGFLDDNCATGAKGKGDEAVLCASAGTPPAGTPPSSVLEYAEVDLASGRAWAAAPRASPGPDYEEIRDSKLRADQPYAVAGNVAAAPMPFYAELGRPTAPPPVPTTKPPVYAQVDKKRPPPPVPPASHRILQDSD